MQQIPLSQAQVFHELYATLQGRHRPEDVAALIHQLLDGQADRILQRLLSRIASKRGYSLMSTDFVMAEIPAEAVGILALLVGVDPVDPTDPEQVYALLDYVRDRIGIAAGRHSFKYDRVNRATRHAYGLEISRRRYNKIFRIVGRIEQATLDAYRKNRLFQLARMAKTGFAAQIPFAAFAAHPVTAACVAYITANLGRRSQFTNAAQARAFDDVANELLKRCEFAPAAGWFALAHVFPREDVLLKVAAEDRVQLLGVTLNAMHEIAEQLRIAWTKTDIDLATMIVKPGNDSSTWNALAGAWNKARDMWIALMTSLGHQQTFAHFLPGKVMRLMAADVAWWHVHSGHEIAHADVRVWFALPKPWEVMAREAQCTQALIEAACRDVRVNPETSGWTAPRDRSAPQRWQPTPELVHGVSINHPELALWMRKVGFFSGRAIDVGEIYGP